MIVAIDIERLRPRGLLLDGLAGSDAGKGVLQVLEGGAVLEA